MTVQEHSKVKPGFSMPVVPDGFDEVCAFRYTDGEWVLDFVNHDRCDFASETMDIDLDWPWVEGFKPIEPDWQSLGIFTLYA